MKFFAKLGELVYRRWRSTAFDERAFPAIAAAALGELPPDQHTTYHDVIEAFVFDATLPVQPGHTKFGQPPLLVYESLSFYIEVLCWVDGTTAIHQHGFSGAFQVMAGSSIHSTYRFLPRRRINASMELGELSFVGSELLRRGDVRPIEAGRRFIHALFHLDRPSISVVVRTRRELDHGPPWSYLKPGVALDPFVDDGHDTRARVQQLLRALVLTDRPGYDRFVDRVIGECDLPTVFLVARHCHEQAMAEPHRIERERLDVVLQAVAARFGDDARVVLPAIDEAVRDMDLMRRREEIHGIEHRFFLALLVNVPTRAELLDLVAAHAAGDPRATVLRWLRELTREEGPHQATMLELELELDEPLENVRVADLLHATAAGMLDGLGGEALVARLVAETPAFAELGEELSALEAQLRTGALKPLFMP
jgi:hypothetical protein